MNTLHSELHYTRKIFNTNTFDQITAVMASIEDFCQKQNKKSHQHQILEE